MNQDGQSYQILRGPQRRSLLLPVAGALLVATFLAAADSTLEIIGLTVAILLLLTIAMLLWKLPWRYAGWFYPLSRLMAIVMFSAIAISADPVWIRLGAGVGVLWAVASLLTVSNAWGGAIRIENDRLVASHYHFRFNGHLFAPHVQTVPLAVVSAAYTYYHHHDRRRDSFFHKVPVATVTLETSEPTDISSRFDGKIQLNIRADQQKMFIDEITRRASLSETSSS